MKDKTVYILGAGASATAGLPIQSGIIKRIFAPSNEFEDFFSDINFLTSSETIMWLSEGYSYFNESRKKIADFLIRHFCLSTVLNQYLTLGGAEPLKNLHIKDGTWDIFYQQIRNTNIPLEDIFTLLDKSIAAGDDTCSIISNQVYDLKNDLYRCIAYIIPFDMRHNISDPTIEKLSEKLLEKRLSVKMKDDPISVITLNWDMLLDYNLYMACDKVNSKRKRNYVYPDYCFYNYSLEGLGPSTLVKSNKNYNIKLLKLHGSLNWIHCNNCGRVYTSFNSDIGLEATIPTKNITCSYCSLNNKSYSLSPLIITPTLLKNFSCLQIKNVWNNAFIDLSEAKEVIFIGYSFPLADFEFRYLLKRSLNSYTKIKVILIEKDDPKYYHNLLSSISNPDVIDQLSKAINANLPAQRYKDFFLNHEITFYYKGLSTALDEGII